MNRNSQYSRSWVLALLVVACVRIASGGEGSSAFDGVLTPAGDPYDWPQWRGPKQDGVSTESNWTTNWPEGGPKRLWDVDVGEGCSSVSVVGRCVYAFGFVGADTGKRTSKQRGMVLCLDADTGKPRWRTPFTDPISRSSWNASASPTIADGKVYVLDGTGLLACLDASDGRILWQKHLEKDCGAAGKVMYAYGASPLVTHGVVIVPANLAEAELIAFKRNTGEEVWRSEKQRRKRMTAFWSSPVLAELDGNACVVYLTTTGVMGINPADGKTMWHYVYTSPPFPKTTKIDICATPVVWKNRIVAGYHVAYTDKGTMTLCLEITDNQPKLAWTTGHEFATCWHSFVGYGGYVYGVNEYDDDRAKNEFCCYDIRTGKCQWRTKDLGVNIAECVGWCNNFWVAPFMIADGKLICHCLRKKRGGWLVVAKVSPAGYEVLAVESVTSGKKGEPSWGSPVLSNGHIYLRLRYSLICLDVRVPKKPKPNPKEAVR